MFNFFDITQQKNENQLLIDTNRKVEEAYDEVVSGLLWALRIRDHSTEEHSKRVVSMTGALANRLGLPEATISDMKKGARLHDIGKLFIKDNILQKTDALTEEEKESMRMHTVLASKFLEPIKWMSKETKDIPMYHHERWDGTGYPYRLKGLDIPLSARIFSPVDVFDALTSERPYRSAYSTSFALQYIENVSGELFDPTVVKEFVKMMRDNA